MEAKAFINRDQSINQMTLPANSVVLFKKTTSIDVNEVHERINGVFLPGLKNSRPTTVIKHLLSYLIAEFKTVEGIKAKHAFFKNVDGKEVASEISTNRVIAPYLNTMQIYRTDSEGKIKSELKLSNGMTLRNTCLKLTAKHAILNTEGANLQLALDNHAKAVISQSTYLVDVTNHAMYIVNDIKEEEKEVTLKAKTESKKASKTESAQPIAVA